MMQIEQEPDLIPGKPLLATGLLVLAVIAGSVVLVLLFGQCRGLALRPGHGVMPGDRVPVQINSLETGVFTGSTPNERALERERQRLNSYGWVDPARGRIHVPIDVAIELYLGEAGRAP